MKEPSSIETAEFVRNQYKTVDNLNARIRLHQEFRTNPLLWQRWLFDRLQFRPGCRVLELGCGTGILWSENADRIPADTEIVLTDYSEGMVAQARQNLAGSSAQFHFEQMDAQSIPFEDASFDLVLANHMLYHVPDRVKTHSEVNRVLKPSGRLYAATNGGNHLKEINDLMMRFDPKFASHDQLIADPFCFENGAEQLSRFFEHVILERYPNSLEVTDAGALCDYILSCRNQYSDAEKASLASFVEGELHARGGRFHVTIEVGVFIAEHIVQSS